MILSGRNALVTGVSTRTKTPMASAISAAFKAIAAKASAVPAWSQRSVPATHSAAVASRSSDPKAINRRLIRDRI